MPNTIALNFKDSAQVPQHWLALLGLAHSESAQLAVEIMTERTRRTTYAENLYRYTEEKFILEAGEAGGQIKLICSGGRSLFYALAELARRMEDDMLLPGTYECCPSFKVRGYIEGFYGKPWSHAARCSVLKCMAKNRMNTVYYAPKDDDYQEYAQHIPYDNYLYDMTVEDAMEDTGYGTVISGNGKLQYVIDNAPAGSIVTLTEDLRITNIRLKSDICLFIQRGTVLTLTGYMRSNATAQGENESGSGDAYRFLEAEGASNVTITGGGAIRGTGAAYWEEPNLVTITQPPGKYDIRVLEYLHFQQKRTRKLDISTKLVFINGCENVNINNVIFEDSPGWNLSIEASAHCTLRNLVLDSNYHGANTDGIDISATSHVEIRDCYLSVGDDAICLKNDKYYNGRDDIDMEDITVYNCFIRSATNGFKIGTGVYNDIRNVRVSNLIMEVNGIYPGTICGITLLVSEGGTLEDVVVDGVSIQNALAPVFIRLSNRNKFGDQDMTGTMKNITVKNVKAAGSELPIIVAGVEENSAVRCIEGVTLENLQVTYRESRQSARVNRVANEDVDEAAKDYPEAWMMGDVPAHGIYARHVRGITIKNCMVTPRASDKREKIVYYDVTEET